ISNSGNLDTADIDRMVAAAKQYAAEDKTRRELVELKNEVDSLAYQGKKLVAEKGDALPAHISGRLTAAVEAAQQAEATTEKDKLLQLKNELEQAYSQASQYNTADSQAADSSNTTTQAKANDDVIDVDYEAS
ncbi:MAG: dnaK2, partial [Firmicutes bacterium]|nr:dnaK2 [Bacillota bacterium]